MSALDGAVQAPGGWPGGAEPATLDGFHKVLTQHIKNINKRLQQLENKEQTITDGSAIAALSSTPEIIGGELPGSGIGFQATLAGQFDQGYPGEPGFGTVALTSADLADSEGGKELPAGGEDLPSVALAHLAPAGGAGLGSGATQLNGAISAQTFAAMKALALSGQGALAQLAAASGRSKEELLRDPQLLLQAAVAMNPLPGAAAQASVGNHLAAELAGVPTATAAAARTVPLVPAGSMGEPGGAGARDAASVDTALAIARVIGDGAAASAATAIGTAQVSVEESLAAMVRREQGNATDAGAPAGAAERSANSAALGAAASALQQTGVGIPFERMASGHSQQGTGSSLVVADNVQSPGAASEDGRELSQSPGLVAPGPEHDRRVAAMALSATRVPQDALDGASDRRVAADPVVPAGLHGASLMHPVPAPRIDAAGAAVAALPLASGDWGERLGERIRWLSTANMDMADIRLDPPELGPLQVKVQSHRDGASVQFLTHSTLVRDMVEQSLPRLREMLEASGMNLLDVNVAQQQDGGGRGQRETQAQKASYADPVLALDTPADLVAAARTPRGLVDYYA